MSLFSQVLRRATAVKYGREDATDILNSLVRLAASSPSPSSTGDHRQRIAITDLFCAIAKYDNSLVADALQRIRIDPQDSGDGGSASLLASALPRLHCDERIWETVMSTSEAGFAAGKWCPADCRVIVQQAASWGVYPRTTFPSSVEKYVGGRIAHADASDLSLLCTMLTSVTETFKSSLQLSVAQRTMVLMNLLSPKTIGTMCRCWLRATYENDALVAALVPQISKVMEDMTVAHTVAAFAYCCTKPAVGCKPELTAALLTRVAETIEDADGDVLLMLLRALRKLPDDVRIEAHAAWQLVVASISDQCKLLLSDKTNPLSIETATLLLLRYFNVLEHVSPQEELSGAAKNGMRAFADYVVERAEEFVADENPPFPIVVAMAGAGLKETAACATAILREAADQVVVLSALTVFKMLLALADHSIFDKRSFGYLRRCFVETAKGIPLIQLCAAMKCFALSHRHFTRPPEAAADDSTRPTGEETKSTVSGNVEEDAEDEEQVLQLHKQFLEECHSLYQLSDDRKDMKVALSFCRSMHELGYSTMSSAFLELMLSTINSNMESTAAESQSSESAAVAKQALQPLLSSAPTVAAYLDSVVSGGIQREDPRPGAWMKANDPSQCMAPLTPEQQKMRNIVEQMKRIRSTDVKPFETLMSEYQALLPHARHEDLWMPFEAFADKVVKSDKVLHEVLKYIVEKDIVKHMSPFAVSSVLQSLAVIRFTFHGTTKKFLLAVTEEQWGAFDGASLRIVIVSMSRLSLRLPAPLMLIGERTIDVIKQLNPLDIAQMITAFQNLGFHEETVLMALINRAKDISIEFSALSLEMLFTAPYIGRLLTTTEIAEPLMLKLAAYSSQYSANAKQRMIGNLKKCAVGKDLIGSAVRSLELCAAGTTTKRIGITE